MCEPGFTPSKGWLMARTAEQMPTRSAPFDLGGVLRETLVPWRGSNALEGDDGAARAIACAGAVALVALPFLLLASVVLAAPFAAPAAIAAGYLLIPRAAGLGASRGVTVASVVVPLALVMWSLGYLLLLSNPSQVELAAALLAPFFAAAPAVARQVVTTRDESAVVTAQRNAACLDRLARAEAVLVVRGDGTLLAATQAARATLGLSQETSGGDVGRCFGLLDRPKLAEAIGHCLRGEGRSEVTLSSADDRSGRAGYTADVSDAGGGAVSIRLREVQAEVPVQPEDSSPMLGVVESEAPSRNDSEACDVTEAVAFATRCAETMAETRGVTLSAAVEGDLWARCDRQVCRRILHLMIDGALAESRPDGAIALSGRGLRGVVLLRLALRFASDDADAPGRAATWSGLRGAVEEVGGTLVVEETPAETRLSVRLERTEPPPAIAGSERNEDLRDSD